MIQPTPINELSSFAMNNNSYESGSKSILKVLVIGAVIYLGVKLIIYIAENNTENTPKLNKDEEQFTSKRSN